MLRRYFHGSNVDADDPLVWYEGDAQSPTARRYLFADPRGSIVAVTDHTGASIATNTYDEYGIPDVATTGSGAGAGISTKGRFRYTGQAWIPELGMYFYKARIYSPTLGRFLQTDPIGYEDQFNLYAYVGNDPINAVDPTGLEGENCPEGCNLVFQQSPIEVEITTAEADAIYSEGIARGDSYAELGQRFGDPNANHPGVEDSQDRMMVALLLKYGGEVTYASRGMPSLTSGVSASEEAWNAALGEYQAIRLDLAVAYRDAVAMDRIQKIGDVPGLLSPGQIYDFHKVVFENHGLDVSVFGASQFTGSRIEARANSLLWCASCDSE